MNKINGFIKYLENEGKSKNTIASYCRAVHKYKEWYESKFNLHLDILFVENIQEYIQLLKEERNQRGNLISPKTFNQHLNGLRSFNKYLIEFGDMTEEVINRKLFSKIQQEIASPVKYSKQEVNRFFQTILQSSDDISNRESYRDYVIGNLMGLSGCRISEVLSLQLSDVHLDAREIYIRNGKGNKGRTVLLNKKLQRMLSKYMTEIRPLFQLSEVSPYLFLSNRNRSLSRVTVNKSFKKYSEKAGFKQVLQPHDLRHYFCSVCINNGLGIHEVANLAGHSSIQTTSLYTNTDRQVMLSKLENL